jgi:hypothetical protein
MSFGVSGKVVAAPLGISLFCRSSTDEIEIVELLDRYRLYADVSVVRVQGGINGYQLWIKLNNDGFGALTPDFNTLSLVDYANALLGETQNALEREILIALLGSPVCIAFPSVAELLAGLRVRQNIVLAGAKTELNFRTDVADRPDDCWEDTGDAGFVVRRGHSLISALQKATQPEIGGRSYAFSCYRATEYVLLLGIAEEAAVSNPELLKKLQKQCETRVIRSAQFHEVFLQEYGSQDIPLPMRYYVPGDRLWFRNPDERSSDITGYEGSWVIYLGDGLFTNFWKKDQPYTLTNKCLEIYCWRDALRSDGAEGGLKINETIVEDSMREIFSTPAKRDGILSKMMHWRDPKGCYRSGGCIDTTREFPRWICPETCNIVLP